MATVSLRWYGTIISRTTLTMSPAKTRCRGCGCTRPKTTWGWHCISKRCPSSACTINLVPSLLVQLEAYVNGATDTHLIASRRSRSTASNDEDACYLLDNFFMANPGFDDPAASPLP